MDEFKGDVDRQQATKSSGWVKLLRTVAIVGIVLGCLLSVLTGAGIMLSAGTLAAVVVGLLVMIVGSLMAFISAASIMIFLDMATDVKAIRAAEERRR